MSKEKGCKCCKQIWYVDMLDKKLELCPNCYEYCKPLIDGLKIKDKKIADLQHKLKVAEKALELACEPRDDWGGEKYSGTEYDNYYDYFMVKAKEMLENE